MNSAYSNGFEKGFLYGAICAVIFMWLIGCSKNDTSVNVTDPYVPPVITDPEDPIGGANKILAIYSSGVVYFFDGSGVYIFKSGESAYAGFRQIVTNGVKYQCDQTGEIQTQETLSFQSDFYAVDSSENAWSVVVLTPEEALAEGRLYKYYSRFYKNGVEFSILQFRTVQFFSTESDIIAVSDTGAYYCITSVKTGIRASVENGFTVHSVNTDLHTGQIENENITYALNFFLSAKYWVNYNGTWYSQNGYTWDGVTLGQNTTALNCWNYPAEYPILLSENAVVISAGYSVFAGEKVLFFIECNSGWLFKYVPSSDILVHVTRLYTGDGYRDTGIYYSKILNPVIGSDGIYFKFDDGGLYRYRFDSGQIGYISDCDGWIRGWEVL